MHIVLRRLARLLAAPLAILLAFLPVPPLSNADTLDWDMPGGHQFTQAGSFEVSDRGGVYFWKEFQRLGAIDAAGYPISRRFQWNGFTVQGMQRVIFQWRPEVGQVYFVNVFDMLSEAGKDDWLLNVRQTPKPLPASFDAGKSWDQIVRDRLALLDENPAIRQQYYSVVGDPVTINGLPTSHVTDMGNNYTIRAQRVVIQQWKEDVPWAAAGQVTVALGGSIAAEAGLLPAAALVPQPVQSPYLALINAYRAAAGVAPASINPALAKSAQNHVAYYDANRGDPSLVGMGLHLEKPGAPGFTGVTMGDRAKAAGYSDGAITENAGFDKMDRAIQWYMNTVNHRLPLIHPSALDIGYFVSGSTGFGIIDVGLRRDKLNVPLPSVYPADGATDVPTSWDGAETPNPAPGVPRPLGYPITIAFGIFQKVEWKSLELRGPSGDVLEISTPRTDWMRAVAIIPHHPFVPGQTYTATVEAMVDGKPVRKEWRFTTSG